MRKGKNDDDRLLLFVLCCSLFKNFNPYWVGPTKTSQRYFHRCAAASAVCVLYVPLLLLLTYPHIWDPRRNSPL